jgi:hypothetical protein
MSVFKRYNMVSKEELKALIGTNGPAPEATGDWSGKFLDLRYGVFRLAPLSEPTGSGRLG